MKPEYIPNYLSDTNAIYHNLKDLPWLQFVKSRQELFMATEKGLSYTYGWGKYKRTYYSEKFSPVVEEIINKLNKDFDLNYNVCFLNRYDTGSSQLGWHSDDEPEMNSAHPIAGISFGQSREIWFKEKSVLDSALTKENKQMLDKGSLFVMPPGFQEKFVHRIPTASSKSATRISLTFRNYK